MQQNGGMVLAVMWWCIAAPPALLLAIVGGELLASRFWPKHRQVTGQVVSAVLLGCVALVVLILVGNRFAGAEITSGTNALNVSIILGIMALPTVVSVSEDALQATGRELREGAYALGSTRAETLIRVVIPAAGSGICAAIILGIMRVVGETMVVWMASGNASQIPTPWYNLLQPVRTLTATIAGDMGEADHVTGSARYHVLFAMALSLLVIAFACNLASEWAIRRSAAKRGN
jgi:phosphate transport system permease protein